MLTRLARSAPKRFGSVPTPASLSAADALKILQNPATDIVLEPKPQVPEPVRKDRRESIFDLNKSRLEDMYDLFLETKDIEAVNRQFGVQLRGFRYGLPIPNIDPGFKTLPQLKEELRPTPPSPVENLYSALQLTGATSFDEYQTALQRRYNFHELLGGTDDETPHAIEIFEKTATLVIPYAKLRDEKHMAQIRKTFTMNLNIPGCVEVIDPRRFFIDLRPVEEFRHTPQIPISPSEMRRFEEAKAKRRQSPFDLVYSREKLATAALFLAAAGVVGVFFKLGMDAEERMIIDYRRKKLDREQSQGWVN